MFKNRFQESFDDLESVAMGGEEVGTSPVCVYDRLEVSQNVKIRLRKLLSVKNSLSF